MNESLLAEVLALLEDGDPEALAEAIIDAVSQATLHADLSADEARPYFEALAYQAKVML